MKKYIKWSFIIVSSIIFVVTSILTCLFFHYYRTTSFEKEKLNSSSFNITIYNDSENIVKEDNLINHKTVKFDTLPDYVWQSFVSAEDKKFFNHKGLNYKRMIKAMLVNLKNMKFKQGASTISQQLIKNTHLTNEKTFERKLKEIALTKKMEKVMSKKEILESYLNCIYFGNNCYGIESASNFYFSKSAKNLTIEESATLAGIISAPSKYNPLINSDKSKIKRNIVLKNLCDYGTISPTELQTLSNKPIELQISNSHQNKINSYSQMAIDEACSILNLQAKKIGMLGYEIHTYLNSEEQNIIKDIAYMQNNNLQDIDICMINIRNSDGAITSYFGTGNLKLSDIKRQPGSAIKPVLVYAPALEENRIYPCSIIEDSPVSINGYNPQNVTKNYTGNVSVRTALNKSLNTVAVKTLSYVGIDNAKYYASKCGIDFDKDDNNYALALGGFKYGVNLLSLTNSYIPFSNNGNFIKSRFIKYITDKNGNIIYVNNPETRKVFRDDTAYLMTDMLKGCVKFGTSKKLSDLGFEIASKTGTVGTSSGNTDAYNISYTTQNTLGVWVGKLDNKPVQNLSGGKLPSTMAKEFYKKTYIKPPRPFLRPDSVDEIEIDILSQKEKGVIEKANTFTPERYKTKEIFSKFNLPINVSENFVKLDSPVLNSKDANGKKIISFETKDYIEYELIKEKDGKKECVLTCSNTNETQEYVVDTKSNILQSFYVIAKIKNFADNVEVISNKSNVIKFCFSANEKLDKPNDKWYI